MKIEPETPIGAIQFTPATAARLERFGIRTIRDLVELEELRTYRPLRSIGLSEPTIARLKLDGVETLYGFVDAEEHRTKIFLSLQNELATLPPAKRMLLGMSLLTFDWSTRVRNALAPRSYILADLVVRTEREFLDEVPNLGRVALVEIKAKLGEFGFKFRKPL